jgi:serine protease DegQ
LQVTSWQKSASWSIERNTPALIESKAALPISMRNMMPNRKSVFQPVAGLMLILVAPVWASLPAEVDGKPLPSLAPILEEVTPAVVNVHTRTRVQVRSSPFFDDPFFRRFFDLPNVPRERVQQSLGSGVVVDAEAGLILTNNHVIDGADDIAVTLKDGREYSAEFVGSDRDTDLAVIRIDADKLHELPLSDSDRLRVGDFVVAVGNPFGLGQTVTSGIVSALGRSGLRGLEYQNFIQTDASINPGNSGGALIDLRGRLVGINTAIFTPSGGNVGIGFAIPASTADYVMAQLVEFGEVRRGSFGVDVQDIDSNLRDALDLDDQGGAVITRVREGSALAKADLRPGDVIVRVDQRAVRNSQSLRNIEGMLAVDSEVNVTFLRDGREHDVTVRIDEDLDARIAGHRLDERMEGMTLVRISDRSRIPGVLIEEVRRNTNAWEAGLRAGDIVVAVNRQVVRNLGELRTQFPISADRELALEIRRRGVAYLVLLD